MLTTPSLYLMEGSWLKVDGDQVIVKGEFSARLFKQNQIAEELETGTDISYQNKTKKRFSFLKNDKLFASAIKTINLIENK
jgi:hypothetical protein